MVEYINVGDFNHQFDAYILKCSKMEIHHEKAKEVLLQRYVLLLH